MLAYDISDWLASKAPYRVGVSLYAMAFPTRRKLRQYQAQLSRQFIDPGLYAQIKNELRVLAKARPLDEGVADFEELEERKSELDDKEYDLEEREGELNDREQKQAEREEVPEAVYALRRRAKVWHKRQDALRFANLRATTDEERYANAEQLVSVVTPALNGIYAELRAFKKDGIEPTHPDLEDMRDTVAAEVFEYERLHNYGKRNKLTDEQKARLAELRKRYNKERGASYKKMKK